jgi:hypothetical protein
VASIYDAQGDAATAITDNDLLLGTRQKFSPYNYQALLIGNKIQALRPQQVVDQPNTSLTPADSPPSNLLWSAVVGEFGVLRPGISYIVLDQEDGSEVTGTIAYDPTDDRFLLFNLDPDTIPANTMPPVNAVIDPLVSGPGAGLPEPVTGTRYLLTEDTGNEEPVQGIVYNPTAWTGTDGRPLIAHANDIIEYTGTRWKVTFLARTITTTEYVTNITTGIQYQWTGNQWIKSYQGLYPGGTWSLVL